VLLPKVWRYLASLSKGENPFLQDDQYRTQEPGIEDRVKWVEKVPWEK
jgi:hypothetical protein